jgi:hypothetical protein
MLPSSWGLLVLVGGSSTRFFFVGRGFSGEPCAVEMMGSETWSTGRRGEAESCDF